jgi:dolichyl-phosphate beta-glucosyltransferase
VTVLSLVIPCLNEVDRLPPSLRRIADHLEQTGHWLPAELIVVDDGSVDDTAAAARSVPMPSGIRLAVERHDHNRGKGAAVRTGFLSSSGNHLLLCDADLATPIDQLEVLRRRAADGTRVVFGSRALDRSLIAVRQPVYRDLMGRTFNLAVRTLVLPGIHDTQCGFKLFPGPLGRALALEQRVAGFAYDVELLVLARRWGFQIVEVPVAWRHVEASRVRAIRHSSQMIRDVVALWLRKLSGRLPPRPEALEVAR